MFIGGITMSCKQKRQRVRQIIQRLEEVESTFEISYIDDKIIKAIEALLGIKPYSKVDNTEVKKRVISGRGLKCGKKKSHK